MAFDKVQFKRRTQQMAVRVIRLVQSLPHTVEADVIGRQVLRSSTSVGANYRASIRAKSTADCINKLKIVEEEVDESLYWLELLVEAEIIPQKQLEPLMNEINEILAIIVSSLKTLRSQS